MEDSIKVPVIAAGICGSDVMRFKGGYSPESLGHELVVMYRGAAHIVCPMRPCGRCEFCRFGVSQHCHGLTALGRNDDNNGGFCGSVSVTVPQLRRVPECVPLAVATLADPLACVLSALDGLVVNGRRVLIIGDGGIACIAGAALIVLGARIDVVSKCHSRAAKLCATFGYSAITSEEVIADHYDIVLEAVGGTRPTPIELVVRAVGCRGHCRLLGVYNPDTFVTVNARMLLEKEACIRGSKSYHVREGAFGDDDHDHLQRAIDMLSLSPKRFAKVVTHVFDLSDRTQLLQALERHDIGRSVGIMYRSIP
ncbi:alcohol dehydrogenase catalytic domain-containing protein [Actinomyces bowdenii]|uniref:alcohol dehydrogenase catalytic domain-containing protein n=1 Tax=Actinomyces bowdenii TaxID=131109 RepID=UPI00214B3AF2|nr:alcohol dehydrogenase catalytic domain-containing protein [Actinomyces bowdenii]